jgi:hypothetical protein
MRRAKRETAAAIDHTGVDSSTRLGNLPRAHDRNLNGEAPHLHSDNDAASLRDYGHGHVVDHQPHRWNSKYRRNSVTATHMSERRRFTRRATLSIS